MLFLLLLIGLGIGLSEWSRYRLRRDWREAEAALRAFDLSAADRALTRHLERNPSDAEGWFLAARTARRLGRVAQAGASLARYEELAGASEKTRLERALLRVQQGEIGEIDTQLRATIGPDHPDSLLVLEALARGYLKRDRLPDAVQACDLWIARQPEHPWPWVFRGQAFERRGSADQASADYRQALELAPNDRLAHLAFGRLLLLKRQVAAATPHFERLLSLDGTDVEALQGAAACLIESGKPAEAIELLDRAADVQPPTPDWLRLRGKAAIMLGDDAVAETTLRRVVQQSPDDREALYLLVRSLREQKKMVEAAECSDRLTKLDEDLGRLFELQRLMYTNSTDAQPWYEAGSIALRMGCTEQGVRWLDEAIRRRPDHADARAELARYGQKAGHSSQPPSGAGRP